MDEQQVNVETADGLGWDTTSDMAALRRRADRHDTAQFELAVRERELDLRRAGLDLESGPGQYFLRTYSGARDPETIRHTAQQAGVPLKGATQAEPEREEIPYVAGLTRRR